MLIYLCDLAHDRVGIPNDSHPLGIGCLAAYVLEYLNTPTRPRIELFRSPDELREAFLQEPPDIAGFSCFSWNYRLGLQFAEWMKARTPHVFTVMGGPNWPLDPKSQESMLRAMPMIDTYVIGNTYEGEVAFLNVVQKFHDRGSAEETLATPIDGAIWIDRQTGAVIRGGSVPRIRDLDKIPSPYQTGLLDKFFETPLFPKLQIARGCPFGCTFCNSAVRSNNKVARYSLQRMKDDIDYIHAHATLQTPLEFADDNFGMYAEDEAVADHIGHLIETHDWPAHIRTTTGKNRPDRIIGIMDRLKGRLPMTASVQSMTPQVLEAIDRKNIRLDTYSQIQDAVRKRGHISYADLIIGLPGESYETLMSAVDQLFATGVQHIAANQLMLLPGSILAMPAERARHGFVTRHRIVARSVGAYGTGPVVVETEEIVIATDSFSYRDYQAFRRYHLVMTVFYFERNFEEAFEFAHSFGVSTGELIRYLSENLDAAPQVVQNNFSEFIAENEAELFESPEACIEWGRANSDRIVSGEIGGNLLSNYSVKGRLFHVTETIDYLMDSLQSLLEPREDKVAEQIASLRFYYRAVCLSVPFLPSLKERPRINMSHDIDAWRGDGYVRPLSTYRLEHPRKVEATVDPRLQSIIVSRIKGFGEKPTGIGRLTRTWFAHELRRKLERVDASLKGVDSG